MARELLRRHAPQFEERGLTVEGPPEAQTAWVVGDASLIENVVSNYLSNALHHTGEGGTVRIAFTPLANGHCRPVGIQLRAEYPSGGAFPHLGGFLQGG